MSSDLLSDDVCEGRGGLFFFSRLEPLVGAFTVSVTRGGLFVSYMHD